MELHNRTAAVSRARQNRTFRVSQAGRSSPLGRSPTADFAAASVKRPVGGLPNRFRASRRLAEICASAPSV
jgi:hypothetical protein